jgi:hypothetical protein
MVVGIATVRLDVADALSLKDKRRVRLSLVDRLHRRFNIAVAEVADHDARGRLTLGIACVSTDRAHAHAMLEKVVDAIEHGRIDASLVDYEIEIL